MLKAYSSLLAGYLGWGLFPLYWHLLKDVSPLEVTLHRIIWAVPVLALLVHLGTFRRRAFIATLNSNTELKYLFLTAILITINWGIYVWAVANARVVEASMGYFLSPLLHVLAGVFLFKEAISNLKWLAIACAFVGVCYYVILQDGLPWVGMGVGFSFAAYGVLRKMITTGAVVGLYTETLMMAPFALIGILVLHSQDNAAFLNTQAVTDWWLILGGLVTVTPLALFTYGTKILPMTSVGILFFITPSIQFMLGTLVLGEQLNAQKLIAFILIWAGLLIYSFSLLRHAVDDSTLEK